MQIEERLARIEDRLARLETGATAAPAQRPEPVPDEDRFWALTTLKSLVPEPGAVLFTGSVTLGPGAHYEWQEARPVGDLVERDWAELAASLSALAHPVRLTLLHEVLAGHHTVGELGEDERFGTSGQLYHHLRQLVAAGWLQSSGRGRYAVPTARVVPLLAILMGADR